MTSVRASKTCLSLIVGAVLCASSACSSRSPGNDIAAAAPAPETQPAAGHDADRKDSPSTGWVDTVIPEGTAIEVALQESIASDMSAPGSFVRALVIDPVRVDDLEALPAGSVFEGFIGDVIPAALGGESGGSVALRFRIVRTPAGSAAEVAARVARVHSGATGNAPAIVSSGATVADGSIIAAGSSGRELSVEEGTRLTLILEGSVPIKVRQQAS